VTTPDFVPADLAPAFRLHVHTAEGAEPPVLCTSREQLTDVVSLAIEMSGAAFVTPVPEPHADVPLIAICDHIHLDGLAVEVVDRDGVYCSVVPVGTTEHDLRLKSNSI